MAHHTTHPVALLMPRSPAQGPGASRAGHTDRITVLAHVFLAWVFLVSCCLGCRLGSVSHMPEQNPILAGIAATCLCSGRVAMQATALLCIAGLSACLSVTVVLCWRTASSGSGISGVQRVRQVLSCAGGQPGVPPCMHMHSCCCVGCWGRRVLHTPTELSLQQRRFRSASTLMLGWVGGMTCTACLLKCGSRVLKLRQCMQLQQ